MLNNNLNFVSITFTQSKTHTLQADSEESWKEWISSLQTSIDAAYTESCNNDKQEHSCESLPSTETNSSTYSLQSLNTTNENVSKKSQVYQQITSLPGNEKCCDCHSPETKWASINLGITLCIECCGIHRSLGVHVSKVKSLILDDWDKELVKLMLALGNNLINCTLEENLDERGVKRPTANSPASEREAWIRAKYVEKRFVIRTQVKADEEEKEEKKCEEGNKADSCVEGSAWCRSDLLDNNEDCYNLMLYIAARNCDIKTMSKAIGKGASVNWSNPKDEGMFVLHQAVQGGSVIVCEYLLLNGAKNNCQDNRGRTPLHLATESKNIGYDNKINLLLKFISLIQTYCFIYTLFSIFCLLLNRGSDHTIVDESKRNALEIALNNEMKEFVTL